MSSSSSGRGFFSLRRSSSGSGAMASGRELLRRRRRLKCLKGFGRARARCGPDLLLLVYLPRPNSSSASKPSGNPSGLPLAGPSPAMATNFPVAQEFGPSSLFDSAQIRVYLIFVYWVKSFFYFSDKFFFLIAVMSFYWL